MSEFTTSKPSPCCPPTRVTPALTKPDDYVPVGTKISLADGALDAYITGEAHAGNGKAVVVIHDIFGWQSGRHMNIADQLADSLEALVIIPDLYHGDKLEMADLGTPRLGEFLKEWAPEKWTPDMDTIYAFLAEKKSNTKVALMGFCWGSWAVARESARNAPIVCGVNAHPSWAIEGMYEGSPTELGAAINHPQLVMACKDDPDGVKPGGEAMKAMLGKFEKADVCKTHVFEESNHGFVSQGDLTDKVTLRDVTVAMQMAETFIKTHM